MDKLSDSRQTKTWGNAWHISGLTPTAGGGEMNRETAKNRTAEMLAALARAETAEAEVVRLRKALVEAQRVICCEFCPDGDHSGNCEAITEALEGGEP